jgi:hypothetical protein
MARQLPLTPSTTTTTHNGQTCHPHTHPASCSLGPNRHLAIFLNLERILEAEPQPEATVSHASRSPRCTCAAEPFAASGWCENSICTAVSDLTWNTHSPCIYPSGGGVVRMQAGWDAVDPSDLDEQGVGGMRSRVNSGAHKLYDAETHRVGAAGAGEVVDSTPLLGRKGSAKWGMRSGAQWWAPYWMSVVFIQLIVNQTVFWTTFSTPCMLPPPPPSLPLFRNVVC